MSGKHLELESNFWLRATQRLIRFHFLGKIINMWTNKLIIHKMFSVFPKQRGRKKCRHKHKTRKKTTTKQQKTSIFPRNLFLILGFLFLSVTFLPSLEYLLILNDQSMNLLQYSTSYLAFQILIFGEKKLFLRDDKYLICFVCCICIKSKWLYCPTFGTKKFFLRHFLTVNCDFNFQNVSFSPRVGLW
jgi:hypothetical protein